MRVPSAPPVLEITDGHGKLLPGAPFRVIATMLHPEDRHKRQRLFDTLEARCVVEGELSEPASHKLKNRGVKLAGNFDSDLASDSAYGVAVTGDLLLLVINAALYSPKDASLARAILVWGEDQAFGKTGGGHSVAASPRSIKAAWARFKPVCGELLILPESAVRHTQVKPNPEGSSNPHFWFFT